MSRQFSYICSFIFKIISVEMSYTRDTFPFKAKLHHDLCEVTIMYIVLFVIAFGAYLLSAFLWMYCSDELPDFNQVIDDLDLVRPQVSDLSHPVEPHLSRYVDQVICPAYHYFVLRNQIRQSISRDSSFWGGLVIHSGCALLLIRLLLKVGFTESVLFCVVLVSAACVLGCWLLSILYKRKLQLKPFTCNKEKTRSQLEQFSDREFDISDDAELNNRLIDLHCRYLMDNQKTVMTRSIVRGIMYGAAGIIYLFVFLPFFNP